MKVRCSVFTCLCLPGKELRSDSFFLSFLFNASGNGLPVDFFFSFRKRLKGMCHVWNVCNAHASAIYHSQMTKLIMTSFLDFFFFVYHIFVFMHESLKCIVLFAD